MPPPRATVEDVFDDDTDLPLPPIPIKRPAAMPQDILPRSPNVSTSQAQRAHTPSSNSDSQSRKEGVVTDIGPYKKWTSIYPIYMDAKRPYATGARRISRDKSLWWPLSKDIAQAAGALGLKALHEGNKCHPRDWENPGRVKVLWKADGQIFFPRAQTRKQLIEIISLAIQAAKPALKPSPESSLSSPPQASTSSNAPRASTSSTQKSKSKSKTSNKGQGGNDTKDKKNPRAKPKAQLSTPPKPLPPLTARLSSFSPMLESGILKETFKAGMNTAGQIPGSEMFLGGGGQAAGGSGAGASGSSGSGAMGMPSKGKRKVVRVRG